MEEQCPVEAKAPGSGGACSQGAGRCSCHVGCLEACSLRLKWALLPEARGSLGAPSEASPNTRSVGAFLPEPVAPAARMCLALVLRVDVIPTHAFASGLRLPVTFCNSRCPRTWPQPPSSAARWLWSPRVALHLQGLLPSLPCAALPNQSPDTPPPCPSLRHLHVPPHLEPAHARTAWSGSSLKA